MAETINVIVRNKTDVLLRTECLSVSMVNDVGPFDILPDHSNFVALIQGEVVIRESSGKTWTRSCVRGLTKVLTNLVDVVFLEE